MSTPKNAPQSPAKPENINPQPTPKKGGGKKKEASPTFGGATATTTRPAHIEKDEPTVIVDQKQVVVPSADEGHRPAVAGIRPLATTPVQKTVIVTPPAGNGGGVTPPRNEQPTTLVNQEDKPSFYWPIALGIAIAIILAALALVFALGRATKNELADVKDDLATKAPQAQVDGLQNKVGVLGDNDQKLQGQIDKVDGRIATIEGQNLDGRIATIEGQNLNGRIGGVESDVSGVKGRLDAAKKAWIAGHAKRLAERKANETLNLLVDGLDARVDSVEGNLDEATRRLGYLEGRPAATNAPKGTSSLTIKVKSE